MEAATFRKNVSGQTLYFALVNATTGGALTGATVTGKRGIDGGAQASVTGTITEDAGGQYHLALSAADTNGNDIGFLFTATNAIPVNITIVTTAGDPTDAVRFGLTALPNAAAEAAGGLYTRGAGAGQINQPANGQIDANAVKLGGTTQTGRDVGASVLLSAGTGAGQLDFTSGVVKANLAQILGTALTETAGQIAAAFKAFFNIASPVLTTASVNQTGDNYARLGAPAGASVSADVAGVLAKTPDSAHYTNARGDNLANLTGDAYVRLGAPAGASIAADLAEIEAETDAIGTDTSGVTTLLARIPGTVQPQTGDSYARLGAPAGVSIAADLAEIEAETDAIGTPLQAGNVTVGAYAAGQDPATLVLDATASAHNGAGTIGADINGAVLDTPGTTTLLTRLTSGRATNLDNLDAASSAIKAKTDNLPASPAAVGSAMALTSGERDSVADALLDRANAVEVGLTPRQAMRLMAAALAGKVSGAGTTTIVIRNAVADSKPRITATVDASGDRSAITWDSS